VSKAAGCCGLHSSHEAVSGVSTSSIMKGSHPFLTVYYCKCHD